MKGLYINALQNDDKGKPLALSITHDKKSVRERQLFHKNKDILQEWMTVLQQQSNNMNFAEKYIQGRKLGNGKFSVVYQC